MGGDTRLGSVWGGGVQVSLLGQRCLKLHIPPPPPLPLFLLPGVRGVPRQSGVTQGHAAAVTGPALPPPFTPHTPLPPARRPRPTPPIGSYSGICGCSYWTCCPWPSPESHSTRRPLRPSSRPCQPLWAQVRVLWGEGGSASQEKRGGGPHRPSPAVHCPRHWARVRGEGCWRRVSWEGVCWGSAGVWGTMQ